MLFETSKARITVPSRSRQRDARRSGGPARSRRARARPRRARTGCGGAADAPRAAVGDEPFGREPGRALARAARSDHMYASDKGGHAGRGRAASTASRATSARAAACATRSMRTSARTRSSCGRDLVDVDAGTERRGAQLGLAVLAGLAKPVPELGVARVDRELLAGLRVLDHDHAGVGELVLARVEEADRDDLVALGQLQQRTLPARSRVMKSEMRTTSERRRIAPSADSSRPVRSVIVPCGPGGRNRLRGEARAPGCGRSAAAASSRSRCRRGSPRRGCRRG